MARLIVRKDTGKIDIYGSFGQDTIDKYNLSEYVVIEDAPELPKSLNLLDWDIINNKYIDHVFTDEEKKQIDKISDEDIISYYNELDDKSKNLLLLYLISFICNSTITTKDFETIKSKI